MRWICPSVKYGSSPHTRGARIGDAAPLDSNGIIPAYAGSTIRAKAYDPNRSDHPRIRGEHARAADAIARAIGSSPHTRGARVRVSTSFARWWIIPAYAGSTKPEPVTVSLPADHPRIRGEHVPDPSQPAPANGSSPHTRGALSEVRQIAEEARIIPAYAGSTPFIAAPPRMDRDHPRIRGEHRRPAPLL